MSTPLSAYATSLEDNEHESVIRICEMTAGLPLAIELAASWLKGLTASQIAFEMRHNLDFLSTTTRNVEERHRSMRAVFDQSWKLLPEAVERDFENIRLAWEWSVKNQQATYLHMMPNGLYLFGFLGSRHLETITIFQQTLAQSVADAPLLGRLLARRWGFLHWWYQADYQEALTKIEQALAIARTENNRFEIAFCHLMAAYTLMSMQRYAEALPHLETSKPLFEALDEPYYVCWALNRLGSLYANLNNPDEISDAMIAQVKAGVAVRGVFESQNASGSGADFNRLKQGGVDVLEDGNCYILHHKGIVIDERTVITGSYNFTGSAERDNDENLVIVDDPGLARAYREEFERVYAQAPTRCR